MLQTSNDVHWVFAHFFKDRKLLPVLYLLSLKLEEGSICIALRDLPALWHLLPEPLQSVDIPTEKELLSSVNVSSNVIDNKPFVLDSGYFYMQRYFRYELQLAQCIHQMLTSESALIFERRQELAEHKNFIRSLFPVQGNIVDWQMVAVLMAMQHSFGIITGGPGTGKTTTVAKLLAISFLMHPDYKVLLAAPTGKAATRMFQSLQNADFEGKEYFTSYFNKLEPSTIHRLLGWKRDSIYFKHDASNPIDADLIVIDECSMIDIGLFAKLLEAIKKETRVILLGDRNQLASVEAGSVFGDLCLALDDRNFLSKDQMAFLSDFMEVNFDESPNEKRYSGHAIALKHSHRFSDDKGIGLLAKTILNNDIYKLESIVNHYVEDDIKFDLSYDEQLFYNFVNGYEDFINERDTVKALQKLEHLRVLCAVREGPNGVQMVNRKIEQYLSRKELIDSADIFYVNRPIMVLKNNYQLNIFNGDIGIIRKNEDGKLRAYFIHNELSMNINEIKIKSVIPSLIGDVETVYAMTIHKSQGSEFERVMLILPDDASENILTRELLYTGITRAKKHVLIQSSMDVLRSSVARTVSRASGLEHRF